MSELGFTSATPILSVADLPRSLDHYETVLGFRVVWRWSDTEQFDGGPPTFACVCRGAVSLFLSEEQKEVAPTWVSLFVETAHHVEQLHEEFRNSGARIVEPPTDCPWGMREMVVEDLDRNTFRIGASLPD